MRPHIPSLIACIGLSACATIPKDIPSTCPSAQEQFDDARRHQVPGSVGVAAGVPLAIGAAALAGAGTWAAVQAATINPTYVIIQEDGSRVNSVEHHTNLATGLGIGSGVAGGFAVALNVGGAVDLVLGRVAATRGAQKLQECLERPPAPAGSFAVAQVLEGGAWVVLDDGRAFRVHTDSAGTAAAWKSGETILVRDGLLFNEQRAEGIKLISAEASAPSTER